jgi:hypothetical protein
MKSKKRTNKSKAPAIADFGLNPDLYDALGDPLEWIDPESGPLIGGDPSAFAGSDVVQVIGDPKKMMRGKKPKYRAMTLDDIEDDCPACQALRESILAGEAPMAYVYE